MDIFGDTVRLISLIATLIIFIIVFLSYMRARKNKIHESKMFLITVGFGVFFIHSVLAVFQVFNSSFDTAFNEDWHALVTLIGLIFILLGILKE